MEMSKHDQVLAGLVLSLQAATMQHLGKITSVVTGKVERDLEQARGTIDILEMLKDKCRQGTPPEILAMLDKAVMELQLNYLDEVKSDQAADQSSPPDAAQGESTETEASKESDVSDADKDHDQGDQNNQNDQKDQNDQGKDSDESKDSDHSDQSKES